LRPDAAIALHNRVQALERAVTRVQNILADLAIDGVKLGGLPLPEIKAGEAERSFEALKENGVIGAPLCKRLRKAQKTRNLIEHDYDKVTVGQLRDTAEEEASIVAGVASRRRSARRASAMGTGLSLTQGHASKRVWA
jgi:uncharacterized protein YutE (UPF0331/DUF86 family)